MHGIRNLVFIFTLALVVTLATGWLMSETIFSPGGFISQSYGFPLPWKDIFASCPPPCIQANGTQYDWATFTADVLFYATIGYLALLYMFREPRRKIRFEKYLQSRPFLPLMMLAVVGLAAGNYGYDSVYGTGNHWTGYGTLGLDKYNFQNANVLTLWVRNFGPGTVTLTNLTISNPGDYGNRATYQISVAINPSTVAAISENTTSQGLQLIQYADYNVQFVTTRNVTITFTVTWT